MRQNKAFLELGGRRLIDRVRDALAPIVQQIRVMGSMRSGDAPTGCQVQRDLSPGLGPLSGIHAAIATTAFEAVVVVACDLPFVASAFLGGLVDRLEPGCQAVVPVTPSGPVPVCAVYRASVLPSLETRIALRQLSACDFVASLETRWVEGDELSELDPEGLCLLNVNTPADYDKARSLGLF